MAAPLTIVSVSAEVAPWSKVGGLADVAASLPAALARRGHHVIGVAPRYREYDGAWDTRRTARFGLFGRLHEVSYFHTRVGEVDRIFVDHPVLRRGGIYGDQHGVYGDNLLRFALLSRAAMEAPYSVGLEMPGDGQDTVFLAHDWHAALVPLYLSARYRAHGLRTRARSVLAIHNLAHQGIYGRGEYPGLDLEPRWWPAMEMGGNMNLLKAGIVSADRVATVSRRYAQEICAPDGGFGLDGILRMRAPVVQGITNGLDVQDWDPSTDTHLAARYQVSDLAGKAACKSALQAELGLVQDPAVPLVGFVGRLDWQKGVDLLLGALPWLREQGAQLVVLGSGDPNLEAALRRAEGPSVKAWIGFSSRLAHRFTAGCDLLVVPSRFEPCGLTQVQAMRYGTVPVVAATGGLVDTVQAYDPMAQTGTGWLFHPGSVDDLVLALGNALYTWRHWPDSFKAIARRGMAKEWSWDAPAAEYEAMMRIALATEAWG